MARVKRGVTAHAKHKKVFKAAKGFYGRRKNTIRIAKQAVEKAQPICLSRPQEPQAHVPRALDPAHQRGGPAVRPDLQPIYRRPRQGRGRRSTARCCPISRSASRRRSRRSSRRPRPRCRRGLDSVIPAVMRAGLTRRSRTRLQRPNCMDARRPSPGCTTAMEQRHDRHRQARAEIARGHRRRRRRGGARSRARRGARQEGLGLRAAEDARRDDAGRAQGAGPAHQRPEGPRHRRRSPRAATRSRTRRSTRGSHRDASTSRCRCARRPPRPGRIHPISQVIDEITAIFADMGFAVAEGPDIETDDYNFTALNFPAGHPAREMHDTFFFNPKPDGARHAAAHAHLAGADPHHAGAEAADPRHHSRPHLSQRLRPDPHADVPSGRGAGDRQGRRISAT